MSEKESKPERYSLDRVTVEMRTELTWEMPGKIKEFPWPLELQGKGSTNEQDGSMHIEFPKGDIFLSFVTAIHELGHLRQEELKPALKAKTGIARDFAQESDAWERGWKRFIKSNPDTLKSLENKFQKYHKQGKLEFASFQELYQWIQQNALRMVEVQRVLFEGSKKPQEERMNMLADELEKIGVRDFLTRYAETRVGEIIDEQKMRVVIKKTLKHIIAE
ncbi:MAG: hypothetical protein AAB912_02495 [Patescibacteria group bacterium]